MNKDPFWLTFGLYGAVGIQLSLAVVAGWWLGGYFDEKFGSAPWLALLGLVAGFSGGLYNLIRLLRWREKNKE